MLLCDNSNEVTYKLIGKLWGHFLSEGGGGLGEGDDRRRNMTKCAHGSERKNVTKNTDKMCFSRTTLS